MLTIIVATGIAVSLACLVLMRGRGADPAQLTQPRPALLSMGVQIICGNCAGEQAIPFKTYLDRFGSCSNCGGSSYVLASAVAVNGAALRAARLREARFGLSQGRVIPFEPATSRASRTERIAV